MTDVTLSANLYRSTYSRLLRQAAVTPGRLLAGVVVGLTVLRLYLAADIGLTNDEAYYRLWSSSPAFSYFDHPPMVAWLMWLGRHLTGDNELGVRLLAPLLLALGSLIQWRAVSLHHDHRTTVQSFWFFLAMPLMAFGGIILTPDLPSVLFYGLVLFALGELERSQNAKWWLAVGVFAGCGLLSKYTNFFAGAAIMIWVVAVPENRKWFRCPEFWVGGLIAAILFSPVVVWNAGHGWASFAKQFGRVTSGEGFESKYVGELLVWLFILASPVIALLALLGLSLATRRAIQQRRSQDVLLVASVVPMLCYFVVHALHSRVMPNWPAPIYPSLATAAAIGLRSYVPEARQGAVARLAVGIGFFSWGVVYLHAATPIVHLKHDPAGEARGWKSFTDAIDKRSEINGDKWIVTSSFQTSAQLSFAFKGRLLVVQPNEQIRYENLPLVPEEILQKPALFVELRKFEHLDAVRKCFATIEPLGGLKRIDGTREGADYALYQLDGFKSFCRFGQGLRAEILPSNRR